MAVNGGIITPVDPNAGSSGIEIVENIAATFVRTNFDIFMGQDEENAYNTAGYSDGHIIVSGKWTITKVNSSHRFGSISIKIDDTVVWQLSEMSSFNSSSTVEFNYASWKQSGIGSPVNTFNVRQNAKTCAVTLVVTTVQGITGNVTVAETKELRIGTLNFLSPTLSSIALNTNSAKTEFVLRETFDYTGLIVRATYTKLSGASYTSSVSGYSVSNPDMTSVGSKTVYVTFGDKSTTYVITVGNPPTVLSSNIDTLLPDTCYSHVNISLSEITFSAKLNYGDGTSETVTISDYTITFGSTTVNNLLFYFPEAGSYTLTLHSDTYGDFVSKTVTVSEGYLTSISASGYQTEYVSGESFTLSGISITGTYNNGVTGDIDLSQCTVEPALNTKLSYSDHNEVQPVLTCNGIQTTLTALTVLPESVSEISIETSPKTSYVKGDTLTLSDLMLVVIYNSGKEETVYFGDSGLSYSATQSGVAINNFVAGEYKFTDIGDVVVTFTYATKTATCTLTVSAPTFASAEADTSEAQTVFVDDTDVFVCDGVKVITHYAENDYTETLTVTMSNVTADSLASLGIDTTAIPTVYTIDVTPAGETPLGYGAKTIYLNNLQDSFGNSIADVSYKIQVQSSHAIKSATPYLQKQKYIVGEKFSLNDCLWNLKDIDDNSIDGMPSTSASLVDGFLFTSARRMEITYHYTSGSFVSEPYTATIIINVDEVDNNHEAQDYKLAFNVPQVTFEEQTIDFGQFYEGNTLTKEVYPLFPANLVYEGNYTGSDANADCLGYIDLGITFYGNVKKRAHVVTFEDTLNPIEGSGNILVKFPHYIEGHSDRINKSRFGIVFNNRLFVSGNPQYKNCDWHSSAVNTTNDEFYEGNALYDLSYFSDLDYCYYGMDDTAIVGYDIFRDGELLVFKEGSRKQATIYRRTRQLVNAMSYDGSSTDEYVEEAFPMYDVNSNGGIGCLSHRSISNFVGDTIVTTRDGLKSITANDNVYNNAKYSRDVSTKINPKIKSEELQGAVLYSFDQKLVLKTKRGVYIGYYELKNENGEYEWYYQEGLDADMFFEYDHELYFGNKSGAIYRFPEENYKYVDKERTYIGAGGVGLFIDENDHTLVTPNIIKEAADTIVVSKNYLTSIEKGNGFNLVRTDGNVIHANLGSFINKNTRVNWLNEQVSGFDQTEYVGEMDADNSTVKIIVRTATGDEDISNTIDAADMFYDGREVYFDEITGGVVYIQPHKKYILERVSEWENIYYVVDEEGEKANLLGVETCRMSFVIDDKAVTRIGETSDYGEDGAKAFELIGDHDRKLDLIYYDKEDSASEWYKAIITKEKNVEAFFVTIPYSFGSLSHTKTIWSWTVANDTDLNSYMDVGFVSSTSQGNVKLDWAVKTATGASEYDFSTITIDKIKFTSDKLPHVHVRYRTLPAINFVRFVFYNNQDTDMVLSELELVYSVSSFTKGVK